VFHSHSRFAPFAESVSVSNVAWPKNTNFCAHIKEGRSAKLRSAEKCSSLKLRITPDRIVISGNTGLSGRFYRTKALVPREVAARGHLCGHACALPKARLGQRFNGRLRRVTRALRPQTAVTTVITRDTGSHLKSRALQSERYVMRRDSRSRGT